MKLLGYILFVVCMTIGAYIYNEYGFGTMILYYAGVLCFSLYKIFTEEM